METMRYTRLSDVQKFAKTYYLAHHKRIPFLDIIQYFAQNNLLSEYPYKFRPASRFLNPEEFSEHIGTQLVNANVVLKSQEPAFVIENDILPISKDIFTVIHLPYTGTVVHAHDFFEINYVYSGSCSQQFASECRQFQEGDLIIIAPNSPHAVYTDEESLIICINIRKSTFDKVFWNLIDSNNLLSSFFKHSLYGYRSENYLTFKIENAQNYQDLIQKIFDETSISDDYSNSNSISLVNLFFGKLLREFGNTIHLFDANKTSSLNNDFPIIIKYVQHNYATVNLRTLSQIFHYSEVYLSKMFKKNLNQNFSHILQNLRLQHAKEYLEFSDYKISDIAQMVGYDSVDHLSRIFKKSYNITPSDFRKQRAKVKK